MYSMYQLYTYIQRARCKRITVQCASLYTLMSLWNSINSETNEDIIHLHCTLQKSTQTHTSPCLRFRGVISRILQRASNNHCCKTRELKLGRNNLIYYLL